MCAEQIPYQTYQDQLTALRRHFHQHPELSMEEKHTSDYVEDYLRALGLQPNRIEAYGVVVMVYAPEEIQAQSKTIGIRAEMDAIPVQEENDIPWKSARDGVMHACGHDAILATVLVLAKLCVQYREQMRVNVKFIFQPAEENGKGTLMMLDGGVMIQPAVDYFVILHYVNDASSGMELHRGASSAAIGSISIKLKGKSAHWSTYEAGIDTIAAASEVLQAIKKINASYQAQRPFILGIGTISGGTAKNVVAGETILEGNLRACRLKDYHQLRGQLLSELERIQRETGVDLEYFIDEAPVPPILNDDRLVDLGLAVGTDVFSSECRLSTVEYLAGDSASLYFEQTKGIFFVFTSEKAGEPPFPLHNGKFDFDEEIMWKAVAVLHQFILKIPEID